MLIKPTAEEAEKYIDFAYELALDPTRSGYPTYTDGIKTKEDFINIVKRGLERQDNQILLYNENGSISGMICFYFVPEDLYLQTVIFNIAGDTTTALDEFTKYCEEHFAGYTLYLGFPGDNVHAQSYLSKNGWTCLDRCFNDVLNFEYYNLQLENGNVVTVNRENFSDFRTLHALVEKDMFWNSDRLYEALDEWQIFLNYQNGKPNGAIYYTDKDILVEIFGVDFIEEKFNETVFRQLLIRVLNECKQNEKKFMVFFNDEESQKTVLELGFTCVGEYVLYIRQV